MVRPAVDNDGVDRDRRTVRAAWRSLAPGRRSPRAVHDGLRHRRIHSGRLFRRYLNDQAYGWYEHGHRARSTGQHRAGYLDDAPGPDPHTPAFPTPRGAAPPLPITSLPSPPLVSWPSTCAD